MRRILFAAVALIALGCSGDDETTDTIPPAAQPLYSYVRSGVKLMFPGIGRLDALLPVMLNPGSPEASGIVFNPDFSPGAPPNTYVFEVPLDGNSNGSMETMITGRATFNGDPTQVGVGFGGHVEVGVESMGGLGDFAGTVDFLLTSEGTRLSGSGTFDEKIMGNTTALIVGEGMPLLLKPATGDANSVANACAYSLDGTMGVTVTSSSSGSLASDFEFDSGSADVGIMNAVYTDENGDPTDVPDTSYRIPCGEGSINDWAGVFEQNYSCLPPETGQARLTLTVTGSNRIHIVDEDPPGSGDTNEYDATIVSGNAHLLRGFFLAGPEGFRYREDFSWTLSDNRASFSQISAYQYFEGPNQGSGGLCSATARRQ